MSKCESSDVSSRCLFCYTTQYHNQTSHNAQHRIFLREIEYGGSWSSSKSTTLYYFPLVLPSKPSAVGDLGTVELIYKATHMATDLRYVVFSKYSWRWQLPVVCIWALQCYTPVLSVLTRNIFFRPTDQRLFNFSRQPALSLPKVQLHIQRSWEFAKETATTATKSPYRSR